jgi:predicted nucleic acid-binding Zn ribbon protein
MPRRPDDDSDEFDLPDGVYHDDEPSSIPCPYCREPLPEDAQFCSRCENYISAEDAPPTRKPIWIWIGLIVCLILAVLMALS